jgi:hypothetical protein
MGRRSSSQNTPTIHWIHHCLDACLGVKGLSRVGSSKLSCLALVFAECLRVERREAWSAVLSHVRWE